MNVNSRKPSIVKMVPRQCSVSLSPVPPWDAFREIVAAVPCEPEGCSCRKRQQQCGNLPPSSWGGTGCLAVTSRVPQYICNMRAFRCPSYFRPQFVRLGRGLNCAGLQIPVKSVRQSVPLNFLCVPTATSIFQFAAAQLFVTLASSC